MCDLLQINDPLCLEWRVLTELLFEVDRPIDERRIILTIEGAR
jgi:hypothetical protein